ncbi:MAG TPA: hypothetical protein VFU22_10435 [Roseiflexaceae bacterium]|nr:hypothetical protein [Roseiflexaceae bacterium]
MATQKRAKRSSSGRPAMQADAKQTPSPASPAIGPTISVTPEPAVKRAAADSLAAERAAMARRRAMIIGGVGVLALLIAFVGYRFLTSAPTAAPVPAAVPTAAPAAAPTAAAIAQPIVAPTAVPAPAAAPTAAAAPVAAAAPTAAPAPAAAPTAAAVAAPAAPITCSAIAGLPVFDGVTCIDQDTDQDDGVLKLENTYSANASADEIRRFYEAAFASNGWTLGDFKYDLNQGQRRASISVDTGTGVNGVVTEVRLTEYLAAAPTNVTCAPIAGLPTFPNAACVKFEPDQDDGVFKAEHTYTTKASPEEVRKFYENALAENGWSGPDFQYELQQGLRRLQVDVETKLGAQGNFTELKIAEK